SGDAGVTGGARCDAVHHQCVRCLTDLDCAAGEICRANQCARGCSAAHPCSGGLACCADRCLDVTADAENCGGCGAACSRDHGLPTCSGGNCGGACDPGFADCDGDRRTNGCE